MLDDVLTAAAGLLLAAAISAANSTDQLALTLSACRLTWCLGFDRVRCIAVT